MIYLLSPQEAPKALRKPKGSYKKFQGRNPYNIFVAILVETMTPKRHFEINWPLPTFKPSHMHLADYYVPNEIHAYIFIRGILFLPSVSERRSEQDIAVHESLNLNRYIGM